jgi:hypothetical protein
MFFRGGFSMVKYKKRFILGKTPQTVRAWALENGAHVNTALFRWNALFGDRETITQEEARKLTTFTRANMEYLSHFSSNDYDYRLLAEVHDYVGTDDIYDISAEYHRRDGITADRLRDSGWFEDQSYDWKLLEQICREFAENAINDSRTAKFRHMACLNPQTEAGRENLTKLALGYAARSAK